MRPRARLGHRALHLERATARVLGDAHPTGWATTGPVAYSACHQTVRDLLPYPKDQPGSDPTPAEIGIEDDVWIAQDEVLRAAS